MPPKTKPIDAHTEQGRELARRLYDYKISRLEQMSAAEKASLMGEFPKLGDLEFEYVIQQVISAKRLEQQRIGWQAIPHDVTVLVIVIVTTLIGVAAGFVAGVFTLVLLESLFQFQFDQGAYQYLSVLVWVTYPAYVWLGFVLYRQGFPLIWVAGIILLTWGGTYVLGVLMRIPSRLFYEAKLKADEDAANRTKKESNKQ